MDEQPSLETKLELKGRAKEVAELLWGGAWLEPATSDGRTFCLKIPGKPSVTVQRATFDQLKSAGVVIPAARGDGEKGRIWVHALSKFEEAKLAARRVLEGGARLYPTGSGYRVEGSDIKFNKRVVATLYEEKQACFEGHYLVHTTAAREREKAEEERWRQKTNREERLRRWREGVIGVLGTPATNYDSEMLDQVLIRIYAESRTLDSLEEAEQAEERERERRRLWERERQPDLGRY